jgi:hypothetical protein
MGSAMPLHVCYMGILQSILPYSLTGPLVYLVVTDARDLQVNEADSWHVEYIT